MLFSSLCGLWQAGSTETHVRPRKWKGWWQEVVGELVLPWDPVKASGRACQMQEWVLAFHRHTLVLPLGCTKGSPEWTRDTVLSIRELKRWRCRQWSLKEGKHIPPSIPWNSSPPPKPGRGLHQGTLPSPYPGWRHAGPTVATCAMGHKGACLWGYLWGWHEMMHMMVSTHTHRWVWAQYMLADTVSNTIVDFFFFSLLE